MLLFLLLLLVLLLRQLLLPARPVRCCPVQLCAMHARVFHLTPALNPSPGWPTLGYMEKPGSGGTTVNTGCTDWACGLRRDYPISQITMNVLRRLSGIDTLQLASASAL